MTLSDFGAALIGVGIVTEFDSRSRPTRDEIARLAYEFYEMRGKRDGHDVEDWLAAERELTNHYK